MAKTRYIVFELNEGGDGNNTWEPFEGSVEARSAKEAMRLTAENQAQQSGEPVKSFYAAVPVGNWTVAPVGVEIQTRITVG